MQTERFAGKVSDIKSNAVVLHARLAEIIAAPDAPISLPEHDAMAALLRRMVRLSIEAHTGIDILVPPQGVNSGEN